jgi:hypothetical protein
MIGAYGCIGVDVVDDPIVGESIELNTYQEALLVGTETQVTARYFDQYGIEQDLQVNWSSSNEIVCTVEIDGVISGLSAGQSHIVASVSEIESPTLLVTVVENPEDVATVSISSPAGNQIQVDQSVQLNIEILNLNGEPIEPASITWESENESILTVNDQGEILGVGLGFTNVRAVVEGISSNSLGISVGQTSRSGNFQGANGYDASGSCELFIDDNGDLKLTLSSDFDTDFALGTYIYLSNSTSGGATASGGLEIQEITSSGTATFNVSNISAETGLNDFDYVIVLCKPAGITFGYAELN